MFHSCSCWKASIIQQQVIAAFHWLVNQQSGPDPFCSQGGGPLIQLWMLQDAIAENSWLWFRATEFFMKSNWSNKENQHSVVEDLVVHEADKVPLSQVSIDQLQRPQQLQLCAPACVCCDSSCRAFIVCTFLWCLITSLFILGQCVELFSSGQMVGHYRGGWCIVIDMHRLQN